MRLAVLLALVGQVVGYAFSVWLLASLCLSAWKAYKSECGKKKYGMERYYVDGNFFCQE